MLSDLIPIDERVKRILRFIILYICGVVLYKQCGLVSIPVFFVVTALTLWLLKINFYHKIQNIWSQKKLKRMIKMMIQSNAYERMNYECKANTRRDCSGTS